MTGLEWEMNNPAVKLIALHWNYGAEQRKAITCTRLSLAFGQTKSSNSFGNKYWYVWWVFFSAFITFRIMDTQKTITRHLNDLRNHGLAMCLTDI